MFKEIYICVFKLRIFFPSLILCAGGSIRKETYNNEYNLKQLNVQINRSKKGTVQFVLFTDHLKA